VSFLWFFISVFIQVVQFESSTRNGARTPSMHNNNTYRSSGRMKVCRHFDVMMLNLVRSAFIIRPDGRIVTSLNSFAKNSSYSRSANESILNLIVTSIPCLTSGYGNHLLCSSLPRYRMRKNHTSGIKFDSNLDIVIIIIMASEFAYF